MRKKKGKKGAFAVAQWKFIGEEVWRIDFNPWTSDSPLLCSRFFRFGPLPLS